MAGRDLVVMAAASRWREAHRKAHASPHGKKRERQAAMQSAMTALLLAETEAGAADGGTLKRQGGRRNGR